MTKLPKARRAPPHAQIRTATDVLPDVLRASLRVVLCGTAVGTASARAGAYYAHKQNKFWKILHETRLTPALLSPHQYRELLRHGIGLTDFVKTHSGMDHQIPLAELAEDSREVACRDAKVPSGVPRLHQQDRRATVLGGPRAYGEQAEQIGDTRIWILPSTSGAANGSWRPELWHRFAEEVRAATK
jgi:double-stranded uracil-DNA glycosylase